MKKLSEFEIQVLKTLWKQENAFLKEIYENFKSPKPAYTTVSTVVGRMIEKNVIAFEKVGRDKCYHSLISKKEYFSSVLKSMISNHFNDSTAQFASFFAKDVELSKEQLKELNKLIENEIANKE